MTKKQEKLSDPIVYDTPGRQYDAKVATPIPDSGPVVGVFYGWEEAHYHAFDGISSSALARINRAPIFYPVPIEETDSMALGSLVHCLILEPAAFEERYAIAPKVDRRYKEGKATWAAFVADLGERIAIDQATHAQAQGMAKSVLSNAQAAAALREAIATEVSLLWMDSLAGQCKARPDAITPTGALDLKTARDASPEGFQRSIVKYCYHQQAAHYLRGLAAHELAAESWQWVVVEPKMPFAVGVYNAAESLLLAGDALRSNNVGRLLDCLLSGEWPSYPPQTLDLPRWYRGPDDLEDE